MDPWLELFVSSNSSNSLALPTSGIIVVHWDGVHTQLVAVWMVLVVGGWVVWMVWVVDGRVVTAVLGSA